MKKSKHRRLLAEAVERAVTQQKTDIEAQQARDLREANRARLALQDAADIALINAGMIPVRVLAYAMIPGSDMVENREFSHGHPIETTVSFRYRGIQPAADAALRAIAKMSGERTER